MVAVAMDKTADTVTSGPVKVRNADGIEVAGPQMLWLAGLSSLTPQSAEPLARAAAEGGLVLADGLPADFFDGLASSARGPGFRLGRERLRRLRRRHVRRLDGHRRGLRQRTFPRDRVRPTARERLHREAADQHFPGGDATQGTATSKPFTIQRRYIGFLIGAVTIPKRRASTC